MTNIVHEIATSNHSEFAVFVGNFCPIHKGHQYVIDDMINKYKDNCILLIENCNSKKSIKNLFPYKSRRNFIKALYPTLKIIGIPEFKTTIEKMVHIIDILESVTDRSVHLNNSKLLKNYFPKNIEGDLEPVFYSGCMEDGLIFDKYEFPVKIVSRFDNDISSKKIRNALLNKTPIVNLDGRIELMVRKEIDNYEY